MKKSLLLFVLFLPLFSNAQLYIKLNEALGLRSDLIFGNKVDFKADAILMDGYSLESEIKDNPIFDYLALQHNGKDQLSRYTYYCYSKSKTKLYKAKILKSIEQIYGKGRVLLSKKDGDYWHFNYKDEEVTFSILPNLSCELTVYTYKFIHAVEKVDSTDNIKKVEAEGYVDNGRVSSTIGKSEHHVYFSGNKKNETIEMELSWLDESSKVIKMKFNTSDAIRLKPYKRIKNNYGARFDKFILPKNLASKIYKSKNVTIYETGKDPEKMELSTLNLIMFRVIYDAVYK